MNIELSQSKWHSNYYKWVFKTEKLPKTLCPYFWSLLGIILLFPIVLLFKLFSFIFRKKECFLSEEEKSRKEKRNRMIANIFGIIAICIYAIFVIGIIILCLLHAHQKYSWMHILKEICTYTGLTAWIFLFLYGLIKTLALLPIEKVGDFFIWIGKSALVQIFWNGLVSIKKRACPIINWK